MTDVIILRHAETIADIAKDSFTPILKGKSDDERTRLSERGLLQVYTTGLALNEFYTDSANYYFGHSPLIRATESDIILHDLIRQAKSIDMEIEGLMERDFGSLEKLPISSLRDGVGKMGAYSDYREALLYSDDFIQIARELGIENPNPGESFRKTADRAYEIAEQVVGRVRDIHSPTEGSVIVLTTHQIFGVFLINAILNHVSSLYYPDQFEENKRYGKDRFAYYHLEPCRFNRLQIIPRGDAINCVIKEHNDRGHLATIGSVFTPEQLGYIEQAKNILSAYRTTNTQ